VPELHPASPGTTSRIHPAPSLTPGRSPASSRSSWRTVTTMLQSSTTCHMQPPSPRYVLGTSRPPWAAGQGRWVAPVARACWRWDDSVPGTGWPHTWVCGDAVPGRGAMVQPARLTWEHSMPGQLPAGASVMMRGADAWLGLCPCHEFLLRVCPSCHSAQARVRPDQGANGVWG